MANTKIVVTLGPASDSLENVKALIAAGAQIFRLNASHGPREQHQERIATIREAERLSGRAVGILLDLQGPKIRLGRFNGGKCVLRTGARFTITTEETLGDENRASTTYSEFANDVRPGDRVLLNDGAVTLRARSSEATSVCFDVISGGPVGDQKGINLPGVKVSAPSLTEKDLGDLAAGLASGIDLVATALACRFKQARAVSRIEEAAGVRELLHSGEGPLLVSARIKEEDVPRVLPIRDGHVIKHRFIAALNSA